MCDHVLHAGPVLALALSPSGQTLLSVGLDRAVVLSHLKGVKAEPLAPLVPAGPDPFAAHAAARKRASQADLSTSAGLRRASAASAPPSPQSGSAGSGGLGGLGGLGGSSQSLGAALPDLYAPLPAFGEVTLTL